MRSRLRARRAAARSMLRRAAGAACSAWAAGSGAPSSVGGFWAGLPQLLPHASPACCWHLQAITWRQHAIHAHTAGNGAQLPLLFLTAQSHQQATAAGSSNEGGPGLRACKNGMRSRATSIGVDTVMPNQQVARSDNVHHPRAHRRWLGRWQEGAAWPSSRARAAGPAQDRMSAPHLSWYPRKRVPSSAPPATRLRLVMP